MINKRKTGVEKKLFIKWKKDELENLLLETGCFNNNLYFKKYLNLIIKNWNTKEINGIYVELHHILPLTVSNFINKLAIENDFNYVYLSYKEHITAHYYLVKCSNNPELTKKLATPLIFILKKYNKNKNKDLVKFLERLQEINNNVTKIIKNNDLIFYNKCNLYFESNKSLNILDEENNWTYHYSINKYLLICKKYKWLNKNPKKNKKVIIKNKYSKQEDLEFYNSVKNYVLCGKMLKDFDEFHGYGNDYTKTRVRRIAKKYNLEKIRTTKKTKEDKIKIYNLINSYKNKTRNVFAFLAKKYNTKSNYFGTLYRRICLELNLPNIIHKTFFTKERAIDFVKNVLTENLKGINNREISKSKGYSKTYVYGIIKHLYTKFGEIQKIYPKEFLIKYY